MNTWMRRALCGTGPPKRKLRQSDTCPPRRTTLGAVPSLSAATRIPATAEFPDMTMADFDIARSRPLRLGIELSATQPWIELTALRGGADGPLDTPMRVQAADLRDAYQKVATIRAESGYEVPTLLDVEVMIAQDSRSARSSLAILD